MGRLIARSENNKGYRFHPKTKRRSWLQLNRLIGRGK